MANKTRATRAIHANANPYAGDIPGADLGYRASAAAEIATLAPGRNISHAEHLAARATGAFAPSYFRVDDATFQDVAEAMAYGRP